LYDRSSETVVLERFFGNKSQFALDIEQQRTTRSTYINTLWANYLRLSLTVTVQSCVCPLRLLDQSQLVLAACWICINLIRLLQNS